MGATLVRSPGCPASPNELLKYEPSTVMLFRRLPWPANENPVPPEGATEPGSCMYWGESRRRSSTRRVIVGRWAISFVPTVVAAPVRSELNTGLVVAVTMIGSSSRLAARSTNRRSAVPPSVRLTWSCTSWRYPTTPAVTRYGPPTRMPGMLNRPSARVTAPYCVPDGPCTATTRAPGNAAPAESLTTPAIAAVVTPRAAMGTGAHAPTPARTPTDHPRPLT